MDPTKETVRNTQKRSQSGHPGFTEINWKKQLVLAITLVALGGIVFWHEFSYRPKSEEAEEKLKKPFPLKTTQVKSIELVSGSSRVIFECQDIQSQLCKPGDHSNWTLTTPQKTKADQSNANALLSSLNNLLASETISLTDETAEQKKKLYDEFGLTPYLGSADSKTAGSKDNVPLKKDSKYQKITVITADDQRWITHLGDNQPIGNKLYTLVSRNGKMEDQIFLVPSFFRSNLEHDLSHWRDKQLMTIAAHEIVGFRYKDLKSEFFGKKDSGAWLLFNSNSKKTIQLPGDAEAIDSLMSAVTYLKAKGFAADKQSDEQGRRALRGVQKVLTLELSRQISSGGDSKNQPETKTEKIALHLYEKPIDKEKTKILATVSHLDPVFELEESVKARLSKTMKDLRMTKLLTSLDRFSAKKIQFEGSGMGSAPLVLVLTDTAWKSETGEPTVIKSEKVQTLLDKLSGKRVTEFLKNAETPSGYQDGLRMTLSNEKNIAIKRYTFWKSKDLLYAKDLMNEKGDALQLDAVLKDLLPWSRDFFSKDTPVSTPQAPPQLPPHEEDAHGHAH